MLAGIREILIISTPRDLPMYKDLLGDSSSLGIKFEYEIRENQNGLGEAFIIVEDFIGGDNVALILKDHIPRAQVHRNPWTGNQSKRGCNHFRPLHQEAWSLRRGWVWQGVERNFNRRKARESKVKLYCSRIILLRQCRHRDCQKREAIREGWKGNRLR